MVAAGEAGGILDTILVRLAQFLEKNDAIVRKVKGAMVYPAVILSVAVIAVSVLLIFVIPTFQNMFASVNLELPLPTRIVIGMSNLLKNYWWALLGALGVIAFGVNQYYKTPPGRLQIDAMLLKLPVLGDVLRKSAVSRFTRTLGTLISSGVSILDGLEITARTAGNMVIHNAVMESRASIAGGETIAQPLAKSKVFPPMVISMIAVGEQTGGMDEMLSKIADFYDDEVDAGGAGGSARLAQDGISAHCRGKRGRNFTWRFTTACTRRHQHTIGRGVRPTLTTAKGIESATTVRRSGWLSEHKSSGVFTPKL